MSIDKKVEIAREGGATEQEIYSVTRGVAGDPTNPNNVYHNQGTDHQYLTTDVPYGTEFDTDFEQVALLEKGKAMGVNIDDIDPVVVADEPLAVDVSDQDPVEMANLANKLQTQANIQYGDNRVTVEFDETSGVLTVVGNDGEVMGTALPPVSLQQQVKESKEKPRPVQNKIEGLEGEWIARQAAQGGQAVQVFTGNKDERNYNFAVDNEYTELIKQERQRLETQVEEIGRGSGSTELITKVLPEFKKLQLSQADRDQFERIKATVRQNAGAHTPQALVDETAARQYMAWAVRNAMDNQGIGSTMVDFAGLVFWPEMSYNMGQVFGMEAFNDSGNFTREFAKQFVNLTPEQKITVGQELIGRFKKVDTNDMRTMIQLMDLMGLSGSTAGMQDLDFAADKLDLLANAYLGTRMSKALFDGVRSYSMIRTIGDVDPDAAALMVEDMIKSGDLDGRLGTTVVEALHATNPFKLKELLNGAPVDVQNAIRKRWNAQDVRTKELDKVWTEGANLTKTEQDVVTSKIIEDLTVEAAFRNIDITDASVVRSDGDGFTIAYKEVASIDVPTHPRNGGQNIDIHNIGVTDLGKTDAGGKVVAGNWYSASTDAGIQNLANRVSGRPGEGTVRHFETPDQLERWLKKRGQFKGETVKAIDSSKMNKKLKKEGHVGVSFGKGFDGDTKFPVQGNSFVVLDEAFDLKYVKARPKEDPRTLYSPTPVSPVDKVINRRFTVDDVTGAFKEDEARMVLGGPFVSKVAQFGDDFEFLVAPFARAMNTSSFVKTAAFSMFNDAFKGLGKPSLQRLDDVMHALNRTPDVIADYNLLVNTGVRGIRLTDKEFVAYTSVRRLNDVMWTVNNIATRQSMASQGLKAIKHGNATVIGKSYDDVPAAMRAYTNDVDNMFVKVTNPNGSTYVIESLKLEKLQELYNKGYVLQRAVGDSDNLFKLGDDGHAMWQLSKADDVSELPAQVLHRVNNYVPMETVNAHWFVKVPKTAIVNGKPTPVGTKTVASFETNEDAQKFLRKMEQHHGTLQEEVPKYKVLFDREMAPADLDQFRLAKVGGLFNTPRGKRPPPHGPKGINDLDNPNFKAKYDNVYAVMEHMINHIASRYPIVEYRHAVEQRFINQVARFNPAALKRGVGFDKALQLAEDVSDATIKRKLMQAGKQIQFMNNIPSDAEKLVQAGIVKTAKWLEPSGLGKYIYKLKDNNPINTMKAVTFNLALGLGNVAQFFIQSAGATVAMSVDSVNAAKVIPKLPAFTILDNIPNPQMKDKVAMILEKKMNMPGLVEDYRLWEGTGFKQGIIHNDSNMAQLYRGNPVNPTWLSKGVRATQFFYKAGELVNTRISFFTALERWKSLNKGMRPGKDDLRRIISRAEAFRLNMSAANKADLQRGWTALSTQFMAVNVRFMEGILGRQFTTAEKIKLGIGQLAFFGSLGLPLANAVLDTTLDKMGVHPGELDEKTYAMLDEGLVGLTFAGMDVDMAKRLALGHGFGEILMDTLFTESGFESVPTLLLGPTYNITIKPGSQKLMDMYNMYSGFTGIDDLTTDEQILMAKEHISVILSMPSSVRKMEAAVIAFETGIYVDKNGVNQLLADTDLAEYFWQAIGFNSKSVMASYEMGIGEFRRSTQLDKYADQMTRAFTRYANAVDRGDITTAQGNKLYVATLSKRFPDIKDQITIQKMVKERMNKGIGELSGGRDFKFLLENWGSSMLNNAIKYNDNMINAVREAQGGKDDR
jgi:hypothetical protein